MCGEKVNAQGLAALSMAAFFAPALPVAGERACVLPLGFAFMRNRSRIAETFARFSRLRWDSPDFRRAETPDFRNSALRKCVIFNRQCAVLAHCGFFLVFIIV